MVDFGCRLTPTDIKNDNSILRKYEFIEELLKGKKNMIFIPGETFESLAVNFVVMSELRAYRNRHSGLSYFQPDANLISAYDLKKFVLNHEPIDFAMHNWTTPVSAIHNIALVQH